MAYPVVQPIYVPAPAAAEPRKARSIMRIQTNVPLPVFAEEDRKDVGKWLAEFDRISARAAAGGDVDPAEYNTLLISATPFKSLAGGKVATSRPAGER